MNSVPRHDKRGTRFELIGEGPNVVLVHGLGLNHQMWRWQSPSLSHRYRLLSYDLLGHGESTHPQGPYTMADFVVQLEQLIDFSRLERFVLIGFSLGGMIAQAYTLAHPERVSGLVVLHSAYDRSDSERGAILERVRVAESMGPGATVERALERWFTPEFARMRPDVLEQVREWVVANDPQAFAASYRVLAEADAPLAGRIADIRCPALVVTGDQDFGNSPQMAARMAKAMPNARCRILPRLRHMALAEQPEAVSSQLLPFLGEVCARSDFR